MEVAAAGEDDGEEAAEHHKHHDGKKPEAKKSETKADAETKSIEARLTALERQQAVMFATMKDIRSVLREFANSESKSKVLANAGAKDKHHEKKSKDRIQNTEQRTKNKEFRTQNKEHRTKNSEYRTGM